MSGAILSLVWAGLVAIATIAVFRRGEVTHRFGVICRVFLVGSVGFVLSYWFVPSAWYGLPGSRLEPLAEFLNGLYLYAFWIFGVFVHVYGLADRGFSLAILTDLSSAPEQGRSKEEIKRAYAGGRGMGYAKEKRLTQLLDGGFIRVEGAGYANTRIGERIGKLSMAFLRLYRFGETG